MIAHLKLDVILRILGLLPMLGIDGMQLLKAETPGPRKDTKLTPRITGTAKALWIVYLVITARGYLDNLGPGLGDVATNFAGVGPAGEWICRLAMLLGRLEIFPLLVLVSPQFWRG